MTRAEAIAALRQHAPELRAAGVRSASLFGSVARGESSAADVDIAVRLDASFSSGGFDYFHQLDQLEQRLSKVLGCKVDVVAEPVRKRPFQLEIDRDRALAF
jgi:predicted nucleotidyltransferase